MLVKSLESEERSGTTEFPQTVVTAMSQPSSTIGNAWEEASSPASAKIVQQFEADWRSSTTVRPDPLKYLPHGPISSQSGVWLALLRSEMGLRHDEGEAVTVDYYLNRYPDLDESTKVALIYEYFCLLEESGNTPDTTELERQYPDLATRLRRVFDIHELIGGSSVETLQSLSGTLSNLQSTVAQNPRNNGPRGSQEHRSQLPSVGESIGGFRLVEELGKGSFARVFLAREEQLADRSVALKVAPVGSREPETLALLQHTHIVPVYSYRVDPVTGLHLLCMPFFSRTTMSSLFEQEGTQQANNGRDLLKVLDRLESAVSEKRRERSAARTAIAQRSIVGAIAWWGARLAEALQHAHDRDVLHRDVKPSNVLVTGDGLPMLLDFNLAIDPKLNQLGSEPAKLGGTLAYMAPEHLEALADGVDQGVGPRADLFSLGVLLFEAISGSRPFSIDRKGRSVQETLRRNAGLRREDPPALRRKGKNPSAALEAVLKHSLAGDPGQRYQSAAEFAADLQAIADDRPLQVAHEPIVSRSLRWIRRHRLKFAVITPIIFAIVLIASIFHDKRIQTHQARETVVRYLSSAQDAELNGELEKAIERYQFAQAAAEKYPKLDDLTREAQEKLHLAELTRDLRIEAEEFIGQAESLRHRLLQFVTPEEATSTSIERIVAPFFVFDRMDWAKRSELTLLDPVEREQLLNGIPELLFMEALSSLSAVEKPDPALISYVLELRDRAVSSFPKNDPRHASWNLLFETSGLADQFSVTMEGEEGPVSTEAESEFLNGLVTATEFRNEPSLAMGVLTIEHLERACRLEPDLYWAQFFLANFALEAGHFQDALRHADVAVSLRPDSPWALFNRSEVRRQLRQLKESLQDLDAAALLIPPDDRDRLADRIALNRGVILLATGKLTEARKILEPLSEPWMTEAGLAAWFHGSKPGIGPGHGITSLIDQALTIATRGSSFGRAARMNLARLDSDEGRVDQALLSYLTMVLQDPEDREARLGLAMTALSRGHFESAETHAGVLIQLIVPRLLGTDPKSITLTSTAAEELTKALRLRALARLALGENIGALRDAEWVYRFVPSPDHRRLLLRTAIATQRLDVIDQFDPNNIELLPVPGDRLKLDLQIALQSLAEPPEGPEVSSISRRLKRASLFSALGQHREALDEATEAIVNAPDALMPRITRAKVLRRAGQLDAAIRDLNAALAIRSDDPDALILRGRLLIETGQPQAGLADLNDAKVLGNNSAELHLARALGFESKEELSHAIEAASAAILEDPDNPILAITRARILIEAGAFDDALVDLTFARSRANQPAVLEQIATLHDQLPGGSEAAQLIRTQSERFNAEEPSEVLE